MAKTAEQSKQGRTGMKHRPPWWLWIAAPIIAFTAVAVFYGVRTRGGDQPTGLPPVPGAPGVVHIHGLGVNPADGDVYAATHMGVFRITENGEASRIANRYQDTMGFTVVGPDHFLASGHPDMREDLPPLLGLLESRDGGRTWRKKSLLGEADFHILRFAHETVYAFNSSGGAFMTSDDGRRWSTRSKQAMRDFVVDPANRERIVATTPNGLEQSADGGRTWTQSEGPAQPLLLDWDIPDRLWLVDVSGRIHLSRDGGVTWEARAGLGSQPEAFDAAGDALYLAAGGSIHISRDEAQSWQVFYKEETDH